MRDLEVRYERQPAVHGIGLEIAEGEAVALIGPNGAGKTSTLQAIMGLRPDVSGDVVLQGRSILGLAPEQVVRKGLALVPEGRQVFTSLTVAENLMLGATVRRDSAVDADLHELLRRFPILGEALHSKASRLSGGEQQQLAIARALLSRPRILLLDEPSLGLAPRMVTLVFEVLSELRAEGITILLVEQNVERAIELADRTYVMATGRITLTGDRNLLTDLGRVEHAYLAGGNGRRGSR